MKGCSNRADSRTPTNREASVFAVKRIMLFRAGKDGRIKGRCLATEDHGRIQNLSRPSEVTLLPLSTQRNSKSNVWKQRFHTQGDKGNKKGWRHVQGGGSVGSYPSSRAEERASTSRNQVDSQTRNGTLSDIRQGISDWEHCKKQLPKTIVRSAEEHIVPLESITKGGQYTQTK